MSNSVGGGRVKPSFCEDGFYITSVAVWFCHSDAESSVTQRLNLLDLYNALQQIQFASQTERVDILYKTIGCFVHALVCLVIILSSYQ